MIVGPINNPLGLTRLVNLNGSITFTVVGTGLITTNQLDVYAPNGSVGSRQSQPLQVDLVRYASLGPTTRGRRWAPWSTRGWWCDAASATCT